ncbi:MAG: hypothetical protein O7A09_06000 [Proteobacteria bacterium]|nr:hypothetical protein [Pseudomonadota bacterium]
MSPARGGRIGLAVLSLALLAGDCGGGDGGGGDPPVFTLESPDARCVALPDPFGFPPGYDFLPGASGRVLAATFSRGILVPLDIRRVPFRLAAGAAAYELPDDSDGNGQPELLLAIDDVFVVDDDLALVTTSGYESVLFVDPAGGPVSVRVDVPAVFGADDFRALPDPGESAIQTGFANFTCIVLPAGALDSRGDPVTLEACRDGAPSFRANFTSGAALAAGRLFLAVSNLGEDRGAEDTQYLPGAVTVYDLDRSRDPPVASPVPPADGGPAVLLHPGGFNASHVQTYVTPGEGRELVLVTLTGAIGIRDDDPDTPVLEGGAVRLTDGAVDVIDAESLELVATIPLRGANPSFRGLALNLEREVAMVGDVTARQLYAIDLSPLDPLPARGPGEILVLDDAAIFNGRDPFRVPALPGGAPAATCPGWIESVVFNWAGDRVYALEACDGALVTLDLLPGGGPVRAADFALRGVVPVTAPLRADTIGLTRLPAAIGVRPGLPGTDFSGPDVFFTVGDPEGLLCGIRVESP